MHVVQQERIPSHPHAPSGSVQLLKAPTQSYLQDITTTLRVFFNCYSIVLSHKLFSGKVSLRVYSRHLTVCCLSSYLSLYMLSSSKGPTCGLLRQSQ